MDVIKAIKERRSIREFSSKKLSREKIEELIDLAIHAPSACDIQGWHFIVLEEPGIKKLIELGTSYFIKNTKTGVLVLYDNRTDNPEYKDVIQSGASAINTLMLAAYSKGIGSCWVCNLPPKNKLKKAFNIPWNYEPIAYVALGYISKKSKKKPRKHKAKDLVSYNTFKSKQKTPSRAQARLRTRTAARKIYHRMPLKRHFKKIADRFERKM